MTTRRDFVLAVGAGALAAPLSGFAQPQGKVWRIGILRTVSPPDPPGEAFKEGLRDLGYVEGKNALIEVRYAGGDMARLPALAAELAQQKMDVIFAPNSIAVEAAKQVTATIPIVFAVVGDPVESGFVASLAHPAGNMTGLTIIAPELSAKRLQLLKEAFPRISRVAIFAAPGLASNAAQVAEAQRASKAFGMNSMSTQLKSRDGIKPELALLHKWRADSIYVTESPTNFFNQKSLVEIAATARLPAIYATQEYATAGGLMSYGPNYFNLFRRAAIYVDKILKGARPGDLPVEQPTTFELVINMQTAKALGVRIPNSILLRADKVIE